MNASFTRPIDPALLEDVLLTRSFRFLTTNIDAIIDGDPNALTVQLLSRDRIAYHHGSQCVLTVLLQASHRKPLLKCTANKDFKDHRLNPECSRHYRRLMHNWVGSDTEKFSKFFKSYLKAVVPVVEPRYYDGDDQGRKAEGYWVNMAYLRFGKEWSKNKPLLVIDREFSLGFPKASDKKAFYNEHASPYMDIKQKLQEDDREKWGKPAKRAPKPEVGLLAVDADGQLVVIEMRRGTNTTGICWAPMSAATHRDALTAALPVVSDSIIELIEQKIALNLLPNSAASRIPSGGFTKVAAAVAVAAPQPDDHHCWSLLEESIKQAETVKPEESIQTIKLFQS